MSIKNTQLPSSVGVKIAFRSLSDIFVGIQLRFEKGLLSTFWYFARCSGRAKLRCFLTLSMDKPINFLATKSFSSSLANIVIPTRYN